MLTFAQSFMDIVLSGSTRKSFVVRSRRMFQTGIIVTASLSVGLLSGTASASSKTPTTLVPLEQLGAQRKVYQQAIRAFERRQYTEAKRLTAMLPLYPLQAHLEYIDLERRLSRLPHTEIDAFLKAQNDTPLAQRLRFRLLKTLARKGRWSQFLKYYNEDTQSTVLRCHRATAHLRTSKKLPLKDIESLWNVGRSQPKECDAAFAAWKKQGHLSPELAWSRHSKAMSSRKLSLAKYLSRSMPKTDQKLAELYLEVDRYPARLADMKKFSTRNAKEQSKLNDVILHGFRRYARQDAKAANKLWGRYDSKNLFEERQRLDTLYTIARRLSQAGHEDQATALLAQYKTIDNTQLIESLIRESLARQDWAKVLYWHDKLPSSAKQHERWQYWLARSLEQTGAAQQPGPGLKPDAIYRKLATQRSFYGFLSADRLGQEYQLQHNPLSVETASKDSLLKHAAVRRAHEFFKLGDNLNANREWFYLANRLEEKEMRALASLTHDWDWHIKTIQGMASIKYWDDLQMRFPLAYSEELKKAAKATKVTPTLLYAIARQESAFAADARSSAGAMGLMQLMPATAKQTARKIGLKYRHKDLYKPGSNITLGSNYLNQLLQRFNGNRALAAAAYNAGPNRVARWLKDSSASLEIDSWIETIPYRETRSYVQNVLSYSVIYAHLMGDKHPLLTKDETQATL